MPRRDNRYWNRREGTLPVDGSRPSSYFNHMPQVGDTVGGKNSTNRPELGPERRRGYTPMGPSGMTNHSGRRAISMSAKRSGIRPGKTSTMGRK